MEFTKKVLGGRVSVERIVSGRGIVNVYEFLYARELTAAKAKGESLSAAVQAVHKEVIAESAEGGKIVGAHEHDDALCAEAMEIMISAYGAETGQSCLKENKKTQKTPPSRQGNLLEDTAGGASSPSNATHHCPLDAVACCSPFCSC